MLSKVCILSQLQAVSTTTLKYTHKKKK